MRKNNSAKKRMGQLQGRGIDECACGEDSSTTCSTCGDQFCRDCKIDHKCIFDPEKNDPEGVIDGKK